jgi:hypothetical protein
MVDETQANIRITATDETGRALQQMFKNMRTAAEGAQQLWGKINSDLERTCHSQSQCTDRRGVKALGRVESFYADLSTPPMRSSEPCIVVPLLPRAPGKQLAAVPRYKPLTHRGRAGRFF